MASNDESSSGSSNIKTTFVTAADVNKKGAGISAFSKAFSGIKNSEFYNEPPPEVIAAAEKGALSAPTSKTLTQNCVIVNSRQRGNPILKSIRNVPWEFGEIVPDYTMGVTTCALFLSLRYHNLNPNYIHDRLKQLGKQYELRVLLAQIDVKDPHHELKQLSKICILADMTLMLAWSADEAGRIIETYKIFENKPPDLIMEKQETNPYSMLIDALTSIKSVNRTDAMTLLSNFGSLENIIGATQDQIAVCPGLGPQKAQRLYNVLHQHFKKFASPRKKSLPIKSTISEKKSEDNPSTSVGSTLPSNNTNTTEKDKEPARATCSTFNLEKT